MSRLKYLLFGLLASVALGSGPPQADRSFKNNKGLFDHISPLLTPAGNASAINNLMLDDRGQLTARPGFKLLATSSGTLTSKTSAITGGGYHNAAVGNSFFAVISGTNVYRTGNTFAGSYTNVTSTVVITAAAANLAQHTALNDVMVFCNESDPPFEVTASTWAYALTGGAPTKMKTCTTYGSYIVGANTTESSIDYPSRIRWSDINNVNSWPALNFVDIEPNDGDKIVSVIAFKDAVYVFKKRSIYRLGITGLDGANAFIVRPFTRNLGAWAKNSVRVIPNVGIVFASQNTLYILNDNELSSYNQSQFEAIGDPIQRSLDTISRANWVNMVGAVYPKRYQYVVSVSTSGSNNTEQLVYDYIQKSWTVYSGMTFDMLEQAEDSTGQNTLLAGDYQGNLYKLDETSFIDTPNGVQIPIATSYTTGWLTQDTPEYTKTYKYLYIFTQAGSTATLTAQAFFDYASSAEYIQTVGVGSTTALYGTAIYGTALFAAAGLQVDRFEVNRAAKAIKLMFSSSSTSSPTNIVGWVLVFTNEDWRQ